jgi:hypothetical protein
MKVFFLSGIAAFLLSVAGVNATDIVVPSNNGLASIPVGNETYFRAETAKRVGLVSAQVYAVFPDVIQPLGLDLNYRVSGNESQLLTAGKGAAGMYLSASADVFQKYPDLTYILKVLWGPDVGSPLYYYLPFRYKAEFRLVKGADGSWGAPASVVGSMQLESADYVYFPFPGASEVRLRWFENGEFKDYSYPYPETIGLQSASARKASGFPAGEEVIPLPTNPLIKGLTGVLTVKGSWGEETILRYGTGTGAKLPGVQEKREPLMVGLRKEWFGVRVLPSGDYTDVSALIFERSKDLQVWRQIVEDGVTAGIADGGMGVIPEGVEFFRARYK